MEFIRFKNEVGGNWSDYNVRLDGQLINKVKRFEYLESIMQAKREIVENVELGVAGWSGEN